MFGIQKAIGNWGELVLGPLLIAIGVFMLLGDRLPLPSFGFRGNGESLARRGGWGALLLGVMFALAFCPTSGVFYFGILIPMSEQDRRRTVHGYRHLLLCDHVFLKIKKMETKNEKKKGFWASLFSPKPCSCSCGGKLIVEEVEKPAAANFDSVRLDMPRTAVREIKILGPGCAKCKATYQVIMKVINENNLDVQLPKIEIMSYNIMSTPAVVVDGVVKIKGHVPSESEVKQILGI